MDIYNLIPNIIIDKIDKEVLDVISDNKNLILEFMDMDINNFNWSRRASNLIENAKISTVKDLLKLIPDKIMEYDHFGKKSLYEIVDIISNGLSNYCKIEMSNPDLRKSSIIKKLNRNSILF